MRRAFLDNIELWLSGAGIAVILLAPQVAHASGDAAWRIGAIVATAVGVLHGLIFWVVRRRQRRIRAQVIAELRGMLRDRVNNNLTVLAVGLSDVKTVQGTGASLQDLHDAVDRISELVGTLSDESIQSWKARYGEVVPKDEP